MGSDPIDEIKQKIDELTDIEIISKLVKRFPELKAEIYQLAGDGGALVKKIDQKKDKIKRYLEISKKLRISPDELNFLLLPDIPVRVGLGKKFIEGVVGFKGLGIETIDHHLEEFNYEKISDYSEEKIGEEISTTTIMYRIPPYMLTFPDKLTEWDKKISDIVGGRFVWLIVPKNMEKRKWRRVTNSKNNIAQGDIQFINGIWTPSKITLMDLVNKCIMIETPALNIKFGSRKIAERLKNIKHKPAIFAELQQLERSEVTHNISLRRWGLRFDYVYFCYWGYGISTDPFDKNCPFNSCQKRLEGICDGERLWSGTYGYRKPFPKIYPLKDTHAQNDGVEIYRESLPAELFTFSAYDFRHIHTYWYGIEIGAWFIRSRPILRLFFGDEKRYFKIGYRIPTTTMEFIINDDWLEEAILDALKDEKIRKNLALKYIFNSLLGRTFEYNRITNLINNLVNKKDEYKILNEILNEKYEENFIAFCKRVFMHSFKHFMNQFVLKDLVGVESNFVIPKYYYNSGKYPNNVNKILIAENARNGRIGIIDTLIKKIEKNGLATFLKEFCKFSINYLEQHTLDFGEIDKERQREASKLLKKAKLLIKDKDKLKRLERLEKAVKTLRENVDNVGINLDSTLARICLLVGGEIDEKTLFELEDHFDDVLDYYGFSLCVDGCNACVRLERECNEGSEQIITTSKLLLLRILKNMNYILEHGFKLSDKGVGRLIEPLLKSARKTILISSPFLSDHYVKKIIKPLAESGVQIRVLTSPIAEGEEKEYHQKALQSLHNLIKTCKNIKVKFLDGLHAKIYIIDGKYVITGSANFTIKGMKHNIEHVEVKMDNKSLIDFQKVFEDMWSKSKSIEKM